MNGKKIKIVGFGDSITEAVIGMPDENKRWLNILKNRLVQEFSSCEFDVVNSGVGGNSARDAMARFENAVISLNPDFVILEFGGNNEDLLKPERIVPLKEFREHLCDYKKRLGAGTRTIVVTIPPVLEDFHSYSKNPAFKEYYRKAGGIDKTVEPYREMTRLFAMENQYPVFDLHVELLKLGKVNGGLTYTLPDGVHLTEAGNEVLADGVFQILKNMI